MIGRPMRERRLYGVVLVVIVLVIGAVFLFRRPVVAPTNTTSTNNPARLTYAQLYDASWRQDQGRGNTTVTATLVTTAMVAALDADTQRSERDEQILFMTKNLLASEVAFIVTIDSISGFFSTSEILDSARLTDSQTNSGREWLIQTWKPIIGAKPMVNTNVQISSQVGILVATMSEEVDWSTLKNLQLEFVNLGDQPIRRFTWAEPSLLASEPE